MINVGDLIIYKPFDNRTGIVVEEDKGYITIQWSDGPKSVIHYQSVIKDSYHTVIKS